MFTEERLFKILDSAVKDISRRVAKVNVDNLPDAKGISSLQPCSIYTKTNGDYDMTFVLCTDYDVLREMTRNMKRGADASEEEVSAYMQEFLNILCGHIVSRMDKSERLKVFFDVPHFVRGEYSTGSGAGAKINGRYYYDSPVGEMELKVLCN